MKKIKRCICGKEKGRCYYPGRLLTGLVLLVAVGGAAIYFSGLAVLTYIGVALGVVLIMAFWLNFYRRHSLSCSAYRVVCETLSAFSDGLF